MNLKSQLADFLNWNIEERNCGQAHISIPDLCRAFLSYGCDYFELMRSFAQIDAFTVAEVETFIACVPETQPLSSLELTAIHAMIPRWTATKYHTAPIREVLVDIQQKIFTHAEGGYVYHSNINPRNTKSPDDPYMLLITTEKLIFLDINRKRAFYYSQSKGGQNL